MTVKHEVFVVQFKDGGILLFNNEKAIDGCRQSMIERILAVPDKTTTIDLLEILYFKSLKAPDGKNWRTLGKRLYNAKEVFDFLDDLRESGETNMFGAVPYLMDELGMDKELAKRWLTNWMGSKRNTGGDKQ